MNTHDTLQQLLEDVEWMRLDDPQTSKHHSDIGAWTDCIACREDFSHNQALTKVASLIKKVMK